MTEETEAGQQSLTEIYIESAIVATANATISAATAGTIFWALRGAAIVATLAGGVPALRNLDPAHLLSEYRNSKGRNEEEEDDELESIVESGKNTEQSR